jgi:hypothetical protein
MTKSNRKTSSSKASKHGILPFTRVSTPGLGRGGGSNVGRGIELSVAPGANSTHRMKKPPTMNKNDDRFEDDIEEEMMKTVLDGSDHTPTTNSTTTLPPARRVIVNPYQKVTPPTPTVINATTKTPASTPSPNPNPTAPSMTVNNFKTTGLETEDDPISPHATVTPALTMPPSPSSLNRTSSIQSIQISESNEIPRDDQKMICDNETLVDLSADRYTGPPSKPYIVPQPEREHHGRYTWKVQARPSANKAEGLRKGILEIWDELFATDPTLVIYPWSENKAGDDRSALLSPDHCPTVPQDLRKFFHKAYHRANGSDTYYIEVRMGHDMSVRDLRFESSEFFGSDKNRNRVGFWYKHLQHDNIVEIGWLLGSTLSMSLDRLAVEVFHRSKRQVEIGCRYKGIALKEFNPNLPPGEFVKAIHIEVKKEQAKAAKKYLTQLFSHHRASDFVMGTPMRLVPVLKDLSTRSERKCLRLRARQKFFVADIRNARTWQIDSVDYRSELLDDKNLRDFIMAIPLANDPNRNLFIACEPQGDGATLFSFLNSHSDEAYNRIHNLLAFLGHHYPDKVSALATGFSAEAREDAADAVWDPVSKFMISPEDAALDAIEDDLEDDFLGQCSDPEGRHKYMMELDGTLFTSTPVIRRSDDSVSTFKSAKKARFDDSSSQSTPRAGTTTVNQSIIPTNTQMTTPSNIQTTTQRSIRTSVQPPTHSGTNRDDISTQSSLTLESALSRISQLEDNMMAIRTDASAMRNDFSTVRQLLQSLSNHPIFSSASLPSNEHTGAGCSS